MKRENRICQKYFEALDANRKNENIKISIKELNKPQLAALIKQYITV
jgi:hypothetical protein